jgi:CO/xanthine dehydrogenase Mo-binding subunit
MSERKFKYVGTRPIRHDGFDKVTGRAHYGADQNLAGMLHGAIVRSPHAHARIKRIDTSKAEALKGVKAVMTGEDLGPAKPAPPGVGPEYVDFRELSLNVIARDTVLYHGHAVAAVAATTLEIARAACKLVEVEYEVLPAVMNLDAALAADAPVLHPDIDDKLEGNVMARTLFERGDLDEGFANADVIVEREFETPMVHQGYIEPHACTVRTTAEGKIEIWCSTQGPFSVQEFTAILLGIDLDRIKVTPSEIGGGFGGKTTIYLEPLAVILSRKSGRPIKMVMNREEVFRASGPTSGSKIKARLGARRDGTLVAADIHMWMEAGAFRGSPVGPACMCAIAPYKVPHFQIEGFDVVVNKPKVAAYRAPGAPMGAFAVESLVDEIARELSMDPIELRLLNAVEEGDIAPYGPRYQAVGLKQTLEAAREHPHYKAPLEENQGRGVACGFWFNAGMQSSATVNVLQDGSAIVRTGNPDIGGSRAALAMQCAEEIGIPVERVRPLVGDTDSVGYTDGTGGSRVTFATGTAVIEASRQVVEELRKRAATIWGVPVEDVKWEDGSAIPLNGASDNKPMTLDELAPQFGATGGPIVESASVSLPSGAPGFVTHLCDIEVDPETGRSQVVRYTTIQDAGKAVHPSYVEGQMQGGAAQGIGWALNEEYIWDAEGVVENPGFLDYRMPVASDLPMIDTVIIEVPNPTHPYGVRGVGEPPIVPPLATVANAVRSATGVRFGTLPLSPPRVLAGILDADR